MERNEANVSLGKIESDTEVECPWNETMWAIGELAKRALRSKVRIFHGAASCRGCMIASIPTVSLRTKGLLCLGGSRLALLVSGEVPEGPYPTWVIRQSA